MPTPTNRTPVRVARGTYSNLNTNKADIQEGEICYATDQDKLYVKEGSNLVDASSQDISGKADLASPTFTGTVAIPNIANLETAVTANTAKVTNATHTGDVTGSTALTIATGAVETGMIADDAVTTDKLANAINTDIAAKAPLASPTFTGTVTAAGIAIDGPYNQVAEAVGALDISLATGNYFTKTISGNSTFTFSNPPASGTVGSFTLELTHSSGTVTWPSSVKFPADTAPTLTTGKTHLFVFVTDDGGTRYRGASLVDYVN